MKDALQLFAEYNRKVNEEMLLILKTVAPEKLLETGNYYYSSVMGLLNHILLGDIIWLRRFADNFAPVAHFNERLKEYRFTALNIILFDTVEALLPHRVKLDGYFSELAQALGEEDFARTLDYKNFHGVPQQKRAGVMLLHVFNHQTHHRGEVTLLLDEMGVDNDYSNLVTKVE